MCCFVLVLGFLGPRLAFLYAWIFTERVSDAFSGGWILPILGLLFLPWTALAYCVAWSFAGGVSGIGWLVVALGFLFDLASYSSRGAQARMQKSNS
ncbi:MAG: hypothetical protein Q8L05_09730 [Actinomycetota bacterium]|nr:hypothetical protein [Actinomycetota bacterium]MDP2287659.1 hypothetical protein [Actinomycetota bacterium]